MDRNLYISTENQNKHLIALGHSSAASDALVANK